MPQRFETAVAHIALYQLAAVAMPLSMLFGPDALEYRINHSEAKLAIVDETAIANVLAARPACPELRTVIGVGAAEGQGDLGWRAALDAGPARFDAMPTSADAPAVLIYTSGTTGPPKGALIPHRALFGNLSGFVASQNWFGFDPAARSADGERSEAPVRPSSLGKREREMGGVGAGLRPSRRLQKTPSVFWSPADWAWAGGLIDSLWPTLYFGREIVAYQGRFAPEKAFELMERHGVTHTFLFPTALKAMMKAVPRPRDRYRLELAAIMSAGEAVGDAVFDYCQRQLGVTVNEMFGQTEVNYIVGNCTRFWPARPGSMGRPYPGHRIAVIDDAGATLPARHAGRRRDPSARHPWRARPGVLPRLLEERRGDRRQVHRRPDRQLVPDRRHRGHGCRRLPLVPGPQRRRLQGGRLPDRAERGRELPRQASRRSPMPRWCRSRMPSAARVVKAFVVLAPGHAASAELGQELQRHVRGKLAPYEYPKEIEFIDELPMTTTGKVQRRVLRLVEAERAQAAADAQRGGG